MIELYDAYLWSLIALGKQKSDVQQLFLHDMWSDQNENFELTANIKLKFYVYWWTPSWTGWSHRKKKLTKIVRVSWRITPYRGMDVKNWEGVKLCWISFTIAYFVNLIMGLVVRGRWFKSLYFYLEFVTYTPKYLKSPFLTSIFVISTSNIITFTKTIHSICLDVR